MRAPLVQLSTYFPDVIRWQLLAASEYAAAILLGMATTVLIEWPFLKLRDRLFPQPATAIVCRPGSSDTAPVVRPALHPENLPATLPNAG